MNTIVAGRIIEICEHTHVVVLQAQVRPARAWQSLAPAGDPLVTREVHMPTELWPSVLIAAHSPGSMLIVTGYLARDHLAQADWIVAARVTIVIQDRLTFPSTRRRLVNELASEARTRGPLVQFAGWLKLYAYRRLWHV